MITFSHVYKSFGSQQVLQDLSFHVGKGETLMIVGPSGTGKSVTLGHILGMIQPDAGEITVAGYQLNGIRKDDLCKLRSKTGMLFQGGALLNWMNIFDNVALPLREKTDLPPDEIREKVEMTLDMVGLAGAEKKMPSEISGGMIKRAGLARAMVCRPEIMLYDEPTSGLDPVMSRRIDELIVHLKKKFRITSVVVTHDLVSAIGAGDRIAMLYEGKVAECAAPADFLHSSNPHVREFISAQFHIQKDLAEICKEFSV